MSEPLKCMLIPTVGRSRAWFAAPFGDNGRFEDLTIERLEMFFGEDRIWVDFERSCDAKAFGAEWARFLRGSVFPTLAAALGGADAARQAQFFDRLEAGVAARLKPSPSKTEIPLARVVLGKGRRRGTFRSLPRSAVAASVD